MNIDVDGENPLKQNVAVQECEDGISVPNWVIEVLAHTERREMANSALSISCWVFKQLCWPKLHEKVKPHRVDKLEFLPEPIDEFGHFGVKLVKDGQFTIPIATVPPPNYITGFNRININIFNGQVLRFLECVDSILDRIHFNFYCHIRSLNNEQTVKIHHFLEMLAPKAFSFNTPRLCDFIQLLPNNADSILQNFQTMVTKIAESDFDFLIKWLNSEQNEQKPKMLFFGFLQPQEPMFKLAQRIIEHFEASTQPANFIIPFLSDQLGFPNLTIQNEKTAEMLAFYSNPNVGGIGPRQFIVRHSKSKEHLRADWDNQIRQQNDLTFFDAEIQQIGEF